MIDTIDFDDCQRGVTVDLECVRSIASHVNQTHSISDPLSGRTGKIRVETHLLPCVTLTTASGAVRFALDLPKPLIKVESGVLQSVRGVE